LNTIFAWVISNPIKRLRLRTHLLNLTQWWETNLKS